MEWEDKVKLVQLGNAINNNNSSKQAFHTYCFEKAKDFDLQAWDMFITIISLIPSEIKEDSEFWTAMWPHIKEASTKNDYPSLRTDIRMTYLMDICKEELKLI